jgi:hypothetical protein
VIFRTPTSIPTTTRQPGPSKSTATGRPILRGPSGPFSLRLRCRPRRRPPLPPASAPTSPRPR